VRAADIQSDNHVSIQVLGERLGNATASVCPLAICKDIFPTFRFRTALSTAKSVYLFVFSSLQTFIGFGQFDELWCLTALIRM
jgi:hypothetical protein